MKIRTYRKFHCTYRSSRLMTIENCQICRRSDNCDIYATMLDEEGDY
jgi:hypothetical protein